MIDTVSTLTGGSSATPVGGTGRSRMGGVENTIEFNGAVLNRRDWWDTFIITSIGGLGDADIRDARESNPGRDGETPFAAYYGGRTIVITGKIRAQSLAKLRDMQKGLKQVFQDISQEQPMYFRAANPENDLMIMVRKSAPIAWDEEQNNFLFERPFQITLRASNPRFMSYSKQQIVFSSTWEELPAESGEVEFGLTNLASADARAHAANATAVSAWSAFFSNSTIYGTPGVGGSTGFTSSGVSQVSFAPTSNFPTGRAFGVSGNCPVSPDGLIVFRHTPAIRTVDFVPGAQYQMVMSFHPVLHVRSPSGTQQVGKNIANYYVGVAYDMVGGGTGSTIRDVTISGTTGSRVSILFTVPAGGISSLSCFISANANTSGYEVRMGDVQVTRTDTTSFDPYFDGESSNALWLGTRYKSLSALVDSTGMESNYTRDDVDGSWYRTSSDGNYRPFGFGIRQVYRNDTGSRVFSNLQMTIGLTTSNIVGASGSIGQFGTIMKRLDPNNMVFCAITAAGANSNLGLWVVDDGVASNWGSSSVFTLAENTQYWLRSRIVGNNVFIELFQSDPALGSSVWKSFTTTLTGSAITKYGSGTTGGFGVRSNLSRNEFWWHGMDIDQVVTDPVVVFNAANEGNAPAQPVFKLFGPISSPTSGGAAVRLGITRLALDGTEYTQNMTIRAKIGSTLALVADHYFYVDASNRVMQEFTSGDVLIRNAYDQLDINSDWIELDPGDNPVEIEMYAAGATPSIEMSYRHAYF
jgi:hypothetical protein